MQRERIGLHQIFREEEDAGAVGCLVHGLNKPQCKFRKLHHRAGDVAENHQFFAALRLSLKAQPIKASAGFQAAADGAAEIQLAGVALFLPLGGELAVDLPRNGGNQRNGAGDFHIPELGDIAVKEPQLRVTFLHAQAGVFHFHLLLQQSPGENGMDKIPVEIGMAVNVALIALHQLAQPFPFFFRHGGVDLLEVFPEMHGLPADLEILFRFSPPFLQRLLALHLVLGLLAHGFLTDEKAVEHTVKAGLLFPGFGKHGAKGGLHLFAIRQPQGDEDLRCIGCLLDAYGESLQPQHPGEDGELFQIDCGITHGDAPHSRRGSHSSLPGNFPRRAH